MSEAEVQLRELVGGAAAGDRVGSVRSICELTGLSTGSAITVMRRLIDEGLVSSTRGPEGGYWRTEAPVPDAVSDVAGELTEVAADLRRAAARLTLIAEHLEHR